jgi:hypothetical protein
LRPCGITLFFVAVSKILSRLKKFENMVLKINLTGNVTEFCQKITEVTMTTPVIGRDLCRAVSGCSCLAMCHATLSSLSSTMPSSLCYIINKIFNGFQDGLLETIVLLCRKHI